MADTIEVEQIDSTTYEVRADGVPIETTSDGIAAFQAGVDAANSGASLSLDGYYEVTGGGVYVDKTLTIDAYDATIHNASGGNTLPILFQGEHTHTHSLSSGVSSGATEIAVSSTNGIAPGTMVGVREDSSFQITDQGEITRVTAVNGSIVTLEDPLWFDYTTANNARVEVFDTISPRVEGLTQTGADAFDEYRGIRFDACDGAEAIDVDAFDLGQDGISIRRSIDCVVRGSEMEGINRPGSGYAVQLHLGATRTLVEQCDIGASRHALNHGGTIWYANRENLTRNCRLFSDTGTPVVFRADVGSEVRDCVIDGTQQYSSTVRWISFNPQVRDCYVIGGDLACVGDRRQGTHTEDALVEGSTLYQPDGRWALYFNDNLQVNLHIRDCEMVGSWTDSALWSRVGGSAEGGQAGFDNLIIEDCYIAHTDPEFDGPCFNWTDDAVNGEIVIRNNVVENHGLLFGNTNFGGGYEENNSLTTNQNVEIPEEPDPFETGPLTRTSYGSHFRPNPNTDGDDIRIGSIEVHDEHPFGQE